MASLQSFTTVLHLTALARNYDRWYSAVYLSLRYCRNTEGSRGDPVAARMRSSPLGCSDPLLWILSFSHDFRPLNFPAAMSVSRDGRSFSAACTTS